MMKHISLLHDDSNVLQLLHVNSNKQADKANLLQPL